MSTCARYPYTDKKELGASGMRLMITKRASRTQLACFRLDGTTAVADLGSNLPYGESLELTYALDAAGAVHPDKSLERTPDI